MVFTLSSDVDGFDHLRHLCGHDWERERKSLPLEIRRLVEMVGETWHCPVCPVHPAMILSTDDTTEYIFQGEKDKKPKFVLSSKNYFLLFLIGAGFDLSNDVAANMTKSWEHGGLLIINESEKEKVGSAMNKASDVQKYHHKLAYTLELGYDLALSSGVNVSQSPGFESFYKWPLTE